MSVYNFIPYCPKQYGKNLGLFYNIYMELLPNDSDWAIIIDHDVMFTHYNWYNQMCDIIKKHGDVKNLGLLTARSARIGNTEQLVNIDKLIKSNDISLHRKYGEKLYRTKYDNIKKIDKQEFSGLLIAIKKEVWSYVGGFKEVGILGIDTDFHWRLKNNGLDVYLMEGVYLYHWYRNNKRNDNKHLI